MDVNIASQAPLSRRDLLRAAALGSAGLAVSTLPLAAAPAPVRDLPSNPDEALRRLMAGNARFVSGRLEEPNRSLERVRELADGQSPFVAVLGCADSRVPVEILFDEGFGTIFTVRVAGNVATPEEIASLEYAVGMLGAPLVMVLGHTSCGAVAAAHAGGAVPGQISSLFQHIVPAIPEGASVDEAVEANVAYQVRALSRASTVIREALDAGSVAVQGAVYGLDDGRVRLVG